MYFLNLLAFIIFWQSRISWLSLLSIFPDYNFLILCTQFLKTFKLMWKTPILKTSSPPPTWYPQAPCLPEKLVHFIPDYHIPVSSNLNRQFSWPTHLPFTHLEISILACLQGSVRSHLIFETVLDILAQLTLSSLSLYLFAIWYIIGRILIHIQDWFYSLEEAPE